MPLSLVFAAKKALPSAKGVTVLIYYSGDNRLSDFMHSSYLRVLREGASRDVNVIVQFDGAAKNDSFRLSIGSTKKAEEFQQTIYEKNIEYDMGNPKTLADFVQWGKTNFPAKRTMLIISSHGFGILNNPYPIHEKKRGAVSKLASSIDDSSHTFMREEEMVAQLKTVLKDQKLDLLVHNSCLMGSLETLTLMSAVAKYAIASEYSIYMNTNDDLINNEARTILIENIIAQIKNDPTVSELEIGKKVVSDFTINYKNFKGPTDGQDDIRYPSTLSLYDLGKIHLLAAEYSRLASDFMQNASVDNTIFTRLFDQNLKARYVDNFGYIDLQILYKSIIAAVYPDSIPEKMSTFQKIVDDVVLEKVSLYTSQSEPTALMHVFFPSILTHAELKPFRQSYAEIKMVQSYGWPAFLNFFWQGFESNRDRYWLSKLQAWSQGETIIVKPTSDSKSHDYDLFLELSMMAIRLRHIEGKIELKKYVELLNTIKRTNPVLDEHRKYVKSLLN